MSDDARNKHAKFTFNSQDYKLVCETSSKSGSIIFRVGEIFSPIKRRWDNKVFSMCVFLGESIKKNEIFLRGKIFYLKFKVFVSFVIIAFYDVDEWRFKEGVGRSLLLDEFFRN